MERLKERAALAPQQLHAVDWALCVGTASTAGRVQEPHALLQLQLEAPAPDSASSTRQSVHAQLNREQMQGLLRKLDVIQGQLERLSRPAK